MSKWTLGQLGKTNPKRTQTNPKRTQFQKKSRSKKQSRVRHHLPFVNGKAVLIMCVVSIVCLGCTGFCFYGPLVAGKHIDIPLTLIVMDLKVAGITIWLIFLWLRSQLCSLYRTLKTQTTCEQRSLNLIIFLKMAVFSPKMIYIRTRFRQNQSL